MIETTCAPSRSIWLLIAASDRSSSLQYGHQWPRLMLLTRGLFEAGTIAKSDVRSHRADQNEALARQASALLVLDPTHSAARRAHHTPSRIPAFELRFLADTPRAWN